MTIGNRKPKGTPVRKAAQRVAVALAGLAAVLALAACTTNAATGKSQLATVMSPEDEAQAGADAHPKIVAAYGGVYDDARVTQYVAGVTARIARGSDRPDITYRVTVLNSPVVNAFALPGGYVYVTRGLLALVNDEAELAGVIGHEIGHVIARHGAQRQTAALGASVLGAVLGAIAGNQAVDQVVGLGGQGLLAGYSRDQEYEADALGVRYLARAGYDPYAQADFLNVMEEQQRLQATLSGQKYDASADWLASHPATPERVAAARGDADETGIAAGAGERGQAALMSAIDGLLYGDGPEKGFVRGRVFVHPLRRIRFEVPARFTLTNADEAVFLQGPDKTIVRFDEGKKSPGTEIGDYLTGVWAEGVRTGKVERLTINGMAGAIAVTRIGDYNARLVAIEAAPDLAYRFLIGTRPEIGTRQDEALHALVMSFRRLSQAEAQAARPLRVRIMTVGHGDTIASIGERMAFSDFRVERFRALNGLGARQALAPGALVKLIVD